MGNCNTQTDQGDSTISLSKAQFLLLHVVGKGGFGRVWRVEHRRTRQSLALKEMSKVRIVNKRSVSSVMSERKLLAVLKHPFIVNMQYAFQDRDNLYLAMDLMPGGDLRFHIGRCKRFNEENTKFFVACIVAGLEYLHINRIIHRDIKPENLVLDERGYVRITDFGIAKVCQKDNAQDTSGTPGYMAPEVLCRQNHGIAVDYFALGVIAYEFMIGRRPYNGRSRAEIKDAVLARQVQLRRQDIPEGWSLEGADFINKLLQRKPANRLGYNGPAEVKLHHWLKDFPWSKLFEKSLEPSFIPAKEENFDKRQVISPWNDAALQAQADDLEVQNSFIGYFFDNSLKSLQVEATTQSAVSNRQPS
jgi:serine/threonine protein kinase